VVGGLSQSMLGGQALTWVLLFVSGYELFQISTGKDLQSIYQSLGRSNNYYRLFLLASY
jgi:hypothetical protein